MAITQPGAAHHTATAELEDLISSWRRHLPAQRISPATLSTYSTSVHQLARFLAERGMPTAPGAICREHIEAFITVSRRYRSDGRNVHGAIASSDRGLSKVARGHGYADRGAANRTVRGRAAGCDRRGQRVFWSDT